MLGLCISFPLIDLLASGSILLLAAILLVQRKSRQGEWQVDGNERTIIQFTIVAVFAVVGFIFFVFAWRPC